MKMIYCGPHVGEVGWEVLRFAPHVLYLKRYNPTIPIIVAARAARKDLYHGISDYFVPVDDLITDDSHQDCFWCKSFGQPQIDIINWNVRKKFPAADITYVEPPMLKGTAYANKNWKADQRSYGFKPRPSNDKFLLETILEGDKRPLIVLAPRYRKGIARNWSDWGNLYNLVWNKYNKSHNIVAVGKYPDMISDPWNRVKDINLYDHPDDCTIMGLTMSAIRYSTVVVGQQSGIPNLARMMNANRIVEWGNQRQLHTVTYNPLRVPIDFVDDMTFTASAETIMEKI